MGKIVSRLCSVTTGLPAIAGRCCVMSVVLCVTFVLGFGLSGCGSPDDEKNGGDGAAFVTGERFEHDLGYVEPEEAREIEFRIENRESQPLEIVKAESDCVCIDLLRVPEEIPAGGSGQLRIRYQSSEQRERYIGRVLLETNSTRRPQILITVRADVGLPLCIRPKDLEIGRLAPGEQRRSEVLLVNRGETSIRATHGSSSSPVCSVFVPQVEVPPGGRLRLPVQITAGREPGERTLWLTVETDLQHQPSVEFRVHYVVADDARPRNPN